MLKNKLTILMLVIILATISCSFPSANPSNNISTPTGEIISPTLVPTASPTPIATPETFSKIDIADRGYFNGNWADAENEYTNATTNPDPDIQSAAYFGLAKTQFATKDYTAALNSLTTIITQYPSATEMPYAYFMMARTFDALGNYTEAAQSYQEYMNLRPGIINAFAFEFKGDSYTNAFEYNSAIDAYQSALANNPTRRTTLIKIKIAQNYVYLNDHNTAIVLYEDIYNQSPLDYIKAQMLRSIGDSYYATGNFDLAYAYYQDVVTNYPGYYDAYIALSTLVGDGIPVNELQRGIIDYYVGEYGLAVAAFSRYQASDAPPDERIYHFKGLALASSGNYTDAIENWQTQINLFPNGTYISQAYDEIAYAQWANLNDYDAGSDTYLEFVEAYPEHPDAAEWLYYAARTAERGGKLEHAAFLWQRVGLEYSNSEFGFEGLFQSGIARYRLRDYAGAQNEFQTALGLANTPEKQAKAYYWIGKTQITNGDRSNGFNSWQQAIESDPTGYYSVRANDAFNGIEMFTPEANINTHAETLATDKQIAEAWIISTFNLPPDTDLTDPTPLSSDPRFVQGVELWKLGLYETARLEFESYRQDITSDPANTYRLANYFIEIGLFRSAIFAGRQVLTLAGYDAAGTLQAPVYLNRIRFGLFYDDLIFSEAQSNQLDPLLIYSVIRQESLFEGFVTSSAGARGLMQIIPSTGDWLYSRTGWPENYTADDLYRPLVNVTYGVSFLSSQVNNFERSIPVALAAYNAGPGNANAWLPLANGDIDLFIEVVRFDETRNYIRSIYENYALYQYFYAED